GWAGRRIRAAGCRWSRWAAGSSPPWSRRTSRRGRPPRPRGPRRGRGEGRMRAKTALTVLQGAAAGVVAARLARGRDRPPRLAAGASGPPREPVSGVGPGRGEGARLAGRLRPLLADPARGAGHG